MFKEIGFFKEYYIDGKFIGILNCDSADREIIGYLGRKSEIFNEKIILSNKKIIKPNIEVMTILYIKYGDKL